METVKYLEKNTSDRKSENRRVKYTNDTHHDPPPPPAGGGGVVTLKFQIGTPIFYCGFGFLGKFYISFI